jgi:uncharacterized protein
VAKRGKRRGRGEILDAGFWTGRWSSGEVAALLDSPPQRDYAGGAMNCVISDRLGEITDLCRKYTVLRLDVFGSVLRPDFDHASSDVDLIAVFASAREPGYADRYLDFAQALENLLGRKVDVLTPGAIRNPRFAESIKAQAVTLYDAQKYQAA